MSPSAPPAASESFRPSAPSRPTLMPPPPERGSVPAWHLGADVRPLRPLPADLAASVTPRPPRPRARTTEPFRCPARRSGALTAAATIASAVVLGVIFGAAVGQALRHRPAPARAPISAR